MSTPLEKARNELIARNEEMMQNMLKGAADDLATTVQADAEQAAQPTRRAECKKRLEAEAEQAGRRRLPSRAASKKTKRKIVGLAEEEAAGSDGSEDMDVEEDAYQAGESSDDAAEFDDDANDAMEAPNQSAKRRAVSTATAKEPVAAAGGAEPMDVEGEDDDEMRMALALSMLQEPGPSAQEDGQGARANKPSTSKRKPRKKKATQEEPAMTAAEELEYKKQMEAAEKQAEKDKKEAERKHGLAIAKTEVDAMFDFLAGDKVTVGLPEFVSVVNRLGLDIDDAMVSAAFDFIEASPYTGPCNRIDRAAFREFVKHLS